MVEPALILPPEPDEQWRMARQIGVTKAVIQTFEAGETTQFWDYEDLLQLQNWFSDMGIDIAVLEGAVPLTDVTRLGLEGQDVEIAAFKQFLRDLGHLGIPTVCYDWMAGPRWARTDVHIEARGGSLTTAYDDEKMEPHPDTPADFTEADLWENLAYFLEEVVPVAEEAGVNLGLHPDDPPRPNVAGYPRIITDVDAYERALNLYESPANGVTFCQGNFAAMGVDVPATIRLFGDDINYVHFRDVKGDADSFVETWHDAGPTNMKAAVEALKHIGFEGVMRPDHVPTMIGESNENPGYEMLGRLFAVGYMRGLLEEA